MGCIYRKSGSDLYMLKVRVQGKCYYRSLKTADRKEAGIRAKKIERELIEGHYKNTNRKSEDLVFKKLADAFMAANHSWKPETRAIYRRVIENFLNGEIQGTAQTKRLHNRHLSAIYSWGIRNGYATRNPFADSPKNSIPKVAYYSDREIAEILDNLPDSKVGDIIRFAFYTGCRLGEMAHLTKEDILEGKIILYGKTGRRTIPLTDKIRETITDRMFEFNENSLRIALFKRGLSATKIRHTFATKLVRKGVSIYMVAKLLGHASVKTTETYYAHLMPEDIKNHTDWLSY